MSDDADAQHHEAVQGKAYRTSLATRLAVTVLLVSIASIVVAVVVSVWSIGGTADELVDRRITTRSNALVDELEFFFRSAAVNVEVLAGAKSTVEAITEFDAAYGELEAIDLTTLDAERESLGVFYLDEFVPALADVRGSSVDPITVAPGSDSAPVYLQAVYIAENPLESGERYLLTDPDDGSTWTEVHRTYHPAFRAQIDGYGFRDLFLVSAESRAIVYSTNKDIAFGTNVVTGPHSGTSMAALARRVFAGAEPGDVLSADIATYVPNLDAPSGFLAAPVYDGDTLVGAAIVSLDLDVISEIMTSDWRDGRFGETGEAYLVGSDRSMRSDSRLFLENQPAYFERVDEVGTLPSEDRSRIESLGTTVLFQPVDNRSVRDGLAGDSGLERVTNYLGVEVFSAYRPVAEDTFDWVLLVEQAVAETDEALSDYVQSVLTVTVVFVVVLTFGAVAWAGGFVAPLRRMGAALEHSRQARDPEPVPVTGVTEFRELAGHLNAMVKTLDDRRAHVLSALRAKTSVLRTLLPPAAVAQAEVGEGGRFIETLPQSTVVVVRLRGLDQLIEAEPPDVSRAVMTSFVQTADRLAASNGLDRVKLAGAAYFAVSGFETPHLDHGPRAVRFASELIVAIDRMIAEESHELQLAAGISSGVTTAGLVGDSRLVFDLWGEPADDAYRLATMAPASEIYLAEGAMARMPDETPAREVGTPLGGRAWAIRASEYAEEVRS